MLVKCTISYEIKAHSQCSFKGAFICAWNANKYRVESNEQVIFDSLS